MFDAVKSASGDQVMTLMLLGAMAAAAIAYRMGYLVVPGSPPRRAPGAPQLPPIVSRFTEPATTQSMVEQHRAAKEALEKRKAQLESELAAVQSAGGSNSAG